MPQPLSESNIVRVEILIDWPATAARILPDGLLVSGWLGVFVGTETVGEGSAVEVGVIGLVVGLLISVGAVAV